MSHRKANKSMTLDLDLVNQSSLKYLIKPFLFLVCLLTFSFEVQGATLGAVMKEISAELRIITTQIENVGANPDSAVRALRMRLLFVSAFGLTPKKIDQAPVSDKVHLERIYHKLLGRVIFGITNLEENLLSNDNAKAKTLLTEINSVRREAHSLLED